MDEIDNAMAGSFRPLPFQSPGSHCQVFQVSACHSPTTAVREFPEACSGPIITRFNSSDNPPERDRETTLGLVQSLFFSYIFRTFRRLSTFIFRRALGRSSYPHDPYFVIDGLSSTISSIRRARLLEQLAAKDGYPKYDGHARVL